MENRIRVMLQKFAAHKDGAIAIIFALSIFVVMGAAGLAVDYGHAMSRKQKLQAAADASALAAAKLVDATVAQRKSTGSSVFNANYGNTSSALYDLAVVRNNSRVRVSVTETVPTYLMRIFGKDNVTIHSDVEVPILKNGFAEVTLVLDYSDSMISNNKYARMAEAGAKMVDAISNNGKTTNVKFALVPFSAVVRADIPAAYLRSEIPYDGCTMDRRYPYNTQEGAIAANDDSKWGDHSVGGHKCSGVAARNLKVLPLTNDYDLVKSTLASFQPHLWTHIAAGAEFGWQTISPDGVFGGARPYTDDMNVKAVIILTDGMQTAPGWGPGGTRTAADAENNLLAICQGMKVRKIQVYTIGYDLTDSHTLNLLSTCSGADKHYASSDVDNGLMTILANISTEIRETMLRLAQ